MQCAVPTSTQRSWAGKATTNWQKRFLSDGTILNPSQHMSPHSRIAEPQAANEPCQLTHQVAGGSPTVADAERKPTTAPPLNQTAGFAAASSRPGIFCGGTSGSHRMS